jgi:hypothetical protein
MALSQAADTAKWLRVLLADLGQTETAFPPVPVYSDNTAAIALARNPRDHAKTKHINVHFHVVGEMVENKVVELEYCLTSKMPADGLTKPLTGILFTRFIQQLSIGPLPETIENLHTLTESGSVEESSAPGVVVAGREWKMGECLLRQIDKEKKRVNYLLMPPKWPGQQPGYIHDPGHN